MIWHLSFLFFQGVPRYIPESSVVAAFAGRKVFLSARLLQSQPGIICNPTPEREWTPKHTMSIVHTRKFETHQRQTHNLITPKMPPFHVENASKTPPPPSHPHQHVFFVICFHPKANSLCSPGRNGTCVCQPHDGATRISTSIGTRMHSALPASLVPSLPFFSSVWTAGSVHLSIISLGKVVPERWDAKKTQASMGTQMAAAIRTCRLQRRQSVNAQGLGSWYSSAPPPLFFSSCAVVSSTTPGVVDVPCQVLLNQLSSISPPPRTGQTTTYTPGPSATQQASPRRPTPRGNPSARPWWR